MKRKDIIYFFVFLGLLAFVFRSLLAGMATRLFDWYDYPLVVWIISNNLDKIIALNFSGIFETNMLYPHPQTLLLTETFFTQSFLVLPFRLFSQNPIFIFNSVFLLTFILNYFSAYLFWGKVFKKQNIAFLGSLLTVFSPFFHAQLGHFQTQSFWPFLLTLYFLLSSEKGKTFKNGVLSGVFLGIQFLASVYLAIFLIISIALYFMVQVVLKPKLLPESLKKSAIIFVSFFLICSPIIAGYLKVQRQYQVQRNYGEYIAYSAHLSDYLFSREIKSAIHSSTLVNKWNSFNKHDLGEGALFPGFFLTTVGVLGILTFKQKRKAENIFFFLLLITGLFFSFGPRVNFNGNYAEIPLPYHFLLKYVPFFDVVRAPARWMLLFYIGLTFFTLKYLSGKTFKPAVFSLLLILIILEYIPLNFQNHAETYLQPKDQVLKELCSQEKKVVLEVPVTHFDAGEGILEGLSYITKTILASTEHKCFLVNGYTSYDLPEISTLKNSLYEASSDQDLQKFTSILDSSQADILVVNENYLRPEIKTDFLAMIEKLVVKNYLLPEEEGVFQIRISSQ